MSENIRADLNLNDTKIEKLRNHFLGWQCRIRQHAVRQADGRPSTGMQPAVLTSNGNSLGNINVLVVLDDAPDVTDEFRHMVRRTHDPKIRRDAAVKYLCSSYYQKPSAFSDRLTAVFALDSAVAAALAEQGSCVLNFEQYNQNYRIPCAVVGLPDSDSHYQATFWHNSLFNPAMPGVVQVLGFDPDWNRAQATPAVT